VGSPRPFQSVRRRSRVSDEFFGTSSPSLLHAHASEETIIPTLPSALICDLRTHPIAPEMSQQSSAPQDGHSQPPHGLAEQQQAPQGQAAPAGDDQTHQLQQVQLEQPDTTLTKIFVGGALPCILYGFPPLYAIFVSTVDICQVNFLPECSHFPVPHFFVSHPLHSRV
jgi:hypothetical protein